MSTQPLKFKLTINSQPVFFTDSEEPSHELREMTAAARDAYLDALTNRMKTDANGKATGVKNFAGLQSDLLTLCLFDKSKASMVPASEIQTWPASVVSDLFQAAQDLNHLKLQEDAPAKNP